MYSSSPPLSRPRPFSKQNPSAFLQQPNVNRDPNNSNTIHEGNAYSDWFDAGETLAWTSSELCEDVVSVQILGNRQKLKIENHHNDYDSELLRSKFAT